MPARSRMIRESPAWDTANGVAAGGFLVSWFAGVNWPQIAAFLAAVYSLFLIAEKLYTWGKRAAQRRREGRGV